jgi:ABC-type glycerol-3-phosphate transport system permease component
MRRTKNILSYILLIFVSLMSLFPFYMMLTMSTFKTEEMFQTIPLYFSNYLMENLKTVFASNFLKSYVVSAE